MRKWRVYFLAFSMAAVISVSSIVHVAEAYLIDKNYVPQEKTNWCWAASAENSVRAVMKPAHTQKEAVKKIKGTAINPYPNKGGSLKEIANAADYISNYNLDYYYVTTALTASALKRYNANGYAPVLVSGEYTDIRAGGHAVILVDCYQSVGGYTIEYYECDQFNAKGGAGYKYCSYERFCNGDYNGRIYDGTVYNYFC